jgi:hypothetical protein
MGFRHQPAGSPGSDGASKMPNAKEMLWTVGLTIAALYVYNKFISPRV